MLGEQMQVAVWALRGNLPPAEMAEVLQEAVKRMGMTTAGLKPAVWQYPLADGKGGVGHTIFQPFGEPDRPRPSWRWRLRAALLRWLLGRQRFASMVVQPLVESFIVTDDYPELGKTYVLAASCRRFSVHLVTRYLTMRVGPLISMQWFEL